MPLVKAICPRCGEGGVHYVISGIAECSDKACWLSKGIPIHDWRSLRFAPTYGPLPRKDGDYADGLTKPIPEPRPLAAIRRAMDSIVKKDYEQAMTELVTLEGSIR